MYEVLKQIPKCSPEKKYFLIDCGAYLMPYLKFYTHTYNRANITPFIKILESYFQLTAHCKNYRFLFFIDNGVPDKIMSMYSAYKGNRKHSKHRRENKIISRNILDSNDYVTNRTLLAQFFTALGEGVFYFNEADYMLGYSLKKMIEQYGIDGTNCYVISHDKDLMALIGYSNCIRRLINNKEKYTKFWMFPKGTYDEYLEKDLHIYSYNEFIIRKALLGDKGDNILAPIMVTESFVNKVFNEYKFSYGYYELDLEKTFEIIKEKLINKKVKKSEVEMKQKIEERLAFELRRNYLIFDVYNSDALFKPTETKFIDVVLQNVLTNNTKRSYESALDLLKRVSMSHAEIFSKWFNDMRNYYKKNK